MNKEAFEAACELLPEGVTWGEPITPSIVQGIVQAVLASVNANEQSQAQQKTLKVSENWREPLSADAIQRLKNLGVLDKPLPPAPEGEKE